ncbi:MAG TPA: VCBS repeat-containing protein [Acidobacteriaceae bacterium]
MTRRLLLALFLLLAPTALLAQTNAITSIEPAQIPAGQNGANLTIFGTFATLGTVYFCFYSAYGSSAPVAGTVENTNTAILSAPADAIQQIPPDSFTGGIANVAVYAVPTSTTVCNGVILDPSFSNYKPVQIVFPSATSFDVTSLPQSNPNLSNAPPREIYLGGSNFAAGISTVTLSGTFISFTPGSTAVTSSSLRIDMPTTLPAGATSLTATVCNNDPSYSYCSGPLSLAITTLAANPGTLVATPSTGTTLDSYSLQATFGSASTAGLPTGLITFTDGTTTLGTAPLKLTSGQFATAAPTTLDAGPGTQTFTPIVADFNKDGLADVLLTDLPDQVFYILRADTVPGAFGGVQTIFPDADFCNIGPASAAVGDFNGDGYPDVAILCNNDSGNNVLVYLNQGDGTFASLPSSVVAAGGAKLITAADLNKDGKIDLVLAGPLAFGGTINGFTLLPGDGTGAFTKSGQITAPAASGTQLAAVDLNNDGYPDLIVLGGPGPSPTPVSVFQNDGKGAFPGTPTYQGVFGDGVSTTAFYTALMPGNKYPNLIAIYGGAATGFAVVTNNQTSTISFSSTSYPVAIPGLVGISVGNFNGDGNPSVATFNGASIQVYAPDSGGLYNSPTASFATPTTGIANLVASDMNGDGYADLIAVTPNNSSPAFAQTYITTGTAAATLGSLSFSAATHSLAATTPGTFTLAPGSATASLVVNPVADSLQLNYSPTSPTYSPTTGETLSLAVITKSLPYATGTVQFHDGETLLGTGTLAGGTTGPGGSIADTAIVAILGAGSHTITANYFGDSIYVPNEISTTFTVNQATPAISWTPNPATIPVGVPLSSAQLDATASVPGSFVYTPAAGTSFSAGTQTLSVTFTPTDTVNYTAATQTVSLQVAALALSSLSSSTAQLGDPAKPITLTGAGFANDAVVNLDGVAIPTTYVSDTTLTATVPAAEFQTIHTIQVTVTNVKEAQTSAALAFAVTAPPVVSVFSGPSTAGSGSQPNLTFQLTNPYPVDITGTLTLTFTPSSGLTDDPAIQFASGGHTMTFTIAANSTASPTIQLQTGSVEGSITVTLALTAGTTDVTPPTIQPITIALPAAAPAIASVSITRSTSTFDVAIQGLSNTRAITQAIFHFTPAAGASLTTTDVTVDAATLFANWYSTDTSTPYGSTFTYTQTFNIDQDASVVGSVTVTLVNGVGSSPTGSAQ